MNECMLRQSPAGTHILRGDGVAVALSLSSSLTVGDWLRPLSWTSQVPWSWCRGASMPSVKLAA